MLSLRLPNPVTGTAPQKPPQNAATTAKTDDKKDDKAEAPKTRDEAWWRKAFADARENVSRAEAQVKVLELQVNDAKTDLLIRNDIFNKEGQLIPRINTLTVDLETAQRRAQEARQKVVDLEDDLRKSGGLPAWAR
jgi:chromosome segregation ATPase